MLDPESCCQINISYDDSDPASSAFEVTLTQENSCQ
jgi:hypothetical protein